MSERDEAQPPTLRQEDPGETVVDRLGRTLGVELPAVGEGPAATGRLGRYPVTGALGAGGMGEVLEVRDLDLGRQVAAKVIRGRPDARALRAFLQEARITGQLEHPSIVPLYELSCTDSGEAFFTMKRVEGEDLAGVLASGDARTRIEPMLRVFLKICEAVAFAHDRGVAHRDLKPANVMIGAFGEVQVMDWGLARVLGGPGEEAVQGTPAYMPPEQAEGRADIDARADVYALGAVLYEMLTLVPPFEGESVEAILDAVRAGRLVAPRRRAPARQIPWELEAVVLRAMAADRDARYASASALREDVERFLESRPLGAARYRVWQLAARWLRRHRVVSAVGAVCLLVLVGLGGWRLNAVLERDRRFAELKGQAIAAARSGDRDSALVLAGLAQRIQADRALAKLEGDLRAVNERARRSADLRRRLFGPRRKIEAMRQILYCAPGVSIAEARREARAALVELDRLAADARFRGFAEVHSLIGLGRFVTGEYALAEPALKEATRLAPGDRWAHRLLARIYLEQAFLEIMASVEVDTPAWLLARGQALVRRAKPHLREGEELEDMLAQVWMSMMTGRQARGLALCDAGLRRHAGALGIEGFHIARSQAAPTLAEKLEHLDQAVGHRPHDMLALTLRAAVLAQLGRLEVALHDADRAVELRPVPMAYNCRAMIHFHLGRPKLALADLEAGLAQERLLYLVRNRALVLRRTGRHAEALRDYEAVLASHPDDYQSLVGRAKIRHAAGELEAAEADYGRAIAADRRRPIAWASRAQLRQDRGRLEGALTDADAALSVTPGDARLHALRGNVLRGMARHAEAREAYDRAVEIDRGLVAAYVSRAALFETLGEMKASRADRERVVELRPRDAEAWSALGVCCARMGDLDAARKALDRAVGLAPSSATFRHHRGYVRLQRKEYDGAIADLTAALEAKADFPEARLKRALAYEAKGQWDRALADLDALLARRPSHPRALYLRATVLDAAGRHGDAVAAFGRVLALDVKPADRAVVLQRRAESRQRAGDAAGALADLKAATGLAPRSWQAWVAYGSALAGAGKTAEAKAAFAAALALDPPAEARARIAKELERLG